MPRAKNEDPPIVVRKKGPGLLWEAQSEKNPQKWYEIDLTEPKCTCTDWSIKTNTQIKNGNTNPQYHCKHIGAVLKQTGVAVPSGSRKHPALPELSDEEVKKKVEQLTSRFRKQS